MNWRRLAKVGLISVLSLAVVYIALAYSEAMVDRPNWIYMEAGETVLYKSMEAPVYLYDYQTGQVRLNAMKADEFVREFDTDYRIADFNRLSRLEMLAAPGLEGWEFMYSEVQEPIRTTSHESQRTVYYFKRPFRRDLLQTIMQKM